MAAHPGSHEREEVRLSCGLGTVRPQRPRLSPCRRLPRGCVLLRPRGWCQTLAGSQRRSQGAWQFWDFAETREVPVAPGKDLEAP